MFEERAVVVFQGADGTSSDNHMVRYELRGMKWVTVEEAAWEYGFTRCMMLRDGDSVVGDISRNLMPTIRMEKLLEWPRVCWHVLETKDGMGWRLDKSFC